MVVNVDSLVFVYSDVFLVFQHHLPHYIVYSNKITVTLSVAYFLEWVVLFEKASA